MAIEVQSKVCYMQLVPPWCIIDYSQESGQCWFNSLNIPLLFQVSFTFGADVVSKFLNRHDLDLICRAHQVLTSLYDVSKVSSPSDYVHCPLCLITNALLQTLLIRLLHSPIIPGGAITGQNNKITQHCNHSRLSKTVTSFSPRGSW